MPLHALLIVTFTQMLRALSEQIAKGAAFVEAGRREPNSLIEARLAPDMFPLFSQVRFACLQAAEAVTRLCDVRAPGGLDDEAHGWEEMREQIARTIAFLEATPETAFEGAEDRAIELSLPNGMVFDMTGAQFARDWAIPQFYFHLVTAYAILRREGVDLGKSDYVRHMFTYMRTKT